MSQNQIAGEIAGYINNNGGGHRGWYVGIATDPRARLFNDHNVFEQDDAWIFRDCGTDTAARNIEQHFLNQGCDGGPGGGDSTTKFIYAYKKARHTVERQ